MLDEQIQTTSTQASTRCFSRVAVTGYYAHYFTRQLEDVAHFQFLSSNGKATLRDALYCYSLTQEETFSRGETPAIDNEEQAGFIVRELQSCGLWDISSHALTVEPSRVGIVYSASKNTLLSNRVLDLREHTSDAPGKTIAQSIGSRGPRLSPVAACATGSHAMSLGAQLIQDGHADVMICGAIEPVLAPLVLAAYRNMNALSKSGIMRPFDVSRDGFVPNVGAGCLILENAEHAQKRGAAVYGYLDGWSMNCDATHMTSMCPSGDSIARAIELSLQRANVQSIDYVNAHGTATKLNDETEARGIVSALGSSVPVSSTKPLTGHLLGAAGAVEAVISLLALRENFIPPTLNLQNQDKECALDCVPSVGRERVLERVLSLNYGFGGHIGVILVSKN